MTDVVQSVQSKTATTAMEVPLQQEMSAMKSAVMESTWDFLHAMTET
jgi:transcriptional regulatory protein LevR